MEKEDHKGKAQRIATEQADIVCKKRKLICSETYRIIFDNQQIQTVTCIRPTDQHGDLSDREQ